MSAGALEALAQGEIVLLETDTLVGLHGLARAPETVRKLTDLKGSSPGRGYLLLFFAIDAVFEAGDPGSPVGEAQLRDLWPGPLTAVLKSRPAAPEHWSSDLGTLAARVPALPSLRSLLQELPGPLFSTSANRAGQPPLRTLAEARREFPELVAGNEVAGPSDVPSTVVDFTVAPPRLLRPGALAWPPGPESDFVAVS